MIFSWIKLRAEVRRLKEENTSLKKVIDEAATQIEHAHDMMKDYIDVMNTVVHKYREEEEDENSI